MRLARAGLAAWHSLGKAALAALLVLSSACAERERPAPPVEPEPAPAPQVEPAPLSLPADGRVMVEAREYPWSAIGR